MIENLRLDSEATVGNNINDPGVTNESLSQGYGGVFHGLAEHESSSNFGTGNANSLYSLDGSTNYVIDEQTHSDSRRPTLELAKYYIPRYNNDNTATPVTTMTDMGDLAFSYGNYYSWTAAVANTTLYRTTSDSMGANTSICPAGWRLPAGSGGELSVLYNALNPNNEESSATLRTFPNNFIYTGRTGRNGISSKNSLGEYYASTGAWEYADRLYWDNVSGRTYIGVGSYPMDTGRTVRCVKT